MSRTWVYEQMTGNSALVTATPGGIKASTAVSKTPHEKPYILYRQTSDVQGFRGDDADMVRRTGFMIFVHDVPGDYLQIDSILEMLRGLFQDTQDQANRVVRCDWITVSEDLRDEDMGTITKFVSIRVTRRL